MSNLFKNSNPIVDSVSIRSREHVRITIFKNINHSPQSRIFQTYII